MPHLPCLQEGNWEKVLAKFKEDGSVQLQNFLKKEWAEQVAQVRRGCVLLGAAPVQLVNTPPAE